MRHAVEAGGRCRAFRVRPAGEVAREEQRADSRDVGLECQREQVELQLDVLVEGLRYAHRHRHVFRRDGRGLHRNLQATLDLANVGRVVVEPLAVGGADARAHAREAAGQRVEDAAVPLAAGGPLLDRAAVAEHPLEHHLRIQLHRQRRGRRRPRDGVGVGAAVALTAVARVGAGVFDGQLQRRQQRIRADLLRDDLIDRRSVVDIRAGGLLRLVGAEERGRNPVVGAGDARRRLRRPRMQTAQNHGLLPERLERLPVERQLGGQCAFGAGHPVAWGSAVRHEAADEALLRAGRGLGQQRRRRHHRVEQGERQRRASTTKNGPP